MRPLSPEELAEIRLALGGASGPCDKTDDLIRFLDAVAISFIDQAFGFSAVQMSLSARANRAFSASDSCERVQLSGKQDKEKHNIKYSESSDSSLEDFSP